MNVTVIGGTGRIGKRVARLLVAHGHDVLAVNRRADRAAMVLPDVPTAVADTNDPATLGPVLTGADAVVLATMPTREDPAAYLTQTAHVLAAVGCRLVAVSNYYALTAPDGRPLLEAEPPHPYFRPIEEVYAAQAALFRSSRPELDWLLVAPPPELYPYGEATGQVRVLDDVLLDFPERATLSMEELAAFVVAEVESPRRHRRLLSVAS